MSALEDIEKVLSLLKDRGAEIRANEALLTEISTALADIVGLMEKYRDAGKGKDEKPLDLSPLVSAIKGLRLEASQVSVNVKPTPVEVKVSPTPVHLHAAEQAAPVVNVHPEIHVGDWTAIEVTPNRGAYGGPAESYTIRKIK